MGTVPRMPSSGQRGEMPTPYVSLAPSATLDAPLAACLSVVHSPPGNHSGSSWLGQGEEVCVHSFLNLRPTHPRVSSPGTQPQHSTQDSTNTHTSLYTHTCTRVCVHTWITHTSSLRPPPISTYACLPTLAGKLVRVISARICTHTCRHSHPPTHLCLPHSAVQTYADTVPCTHTLSTQTHVRTDTCHLLGRHMYNCVCRLISEQVHHLYPHATAHTCVHVCSHLWGCALPLLTEACD